MFIPHACPGATFRSGRPAGLIAFTFTFMTECEINYTIIV